MAKKMCKLVKKEALSECRKKYLDCALPAKYLCEECGRTACKKGYLCSPIKIKEPN